MSLRAVAGMRPSWMEGGGHVVSFPRELVSVLLCPTCRTILDLGSASRCSGCARAYETAKDGRIVRLLKVESLTGEASREREIRDDQAATRRRRSWKEILSDPHESMEMDPTMEWLAVGGWESILELGCGTGRYTERLAAKGCQILAMDFSMQALLKLADALQDLGVGDNVRLVNASIGDFEVAPRSFDVVFSTLTSNLPDRSHRTAMYDLAAAALKPGGRFVFSAHHYGLRDRWTKAAKAGLYRVGGIFRECFTLREIRNEVRTAFKDVRIKPVQIYLPFLSRDPQTRVRVSRLVENIPVLRGLGELLLIEAKSPVRASCEAPDRTGRATVSRPVERPSAEPEPPLLRE
jgi:SAM-dependent methyltransferase